MKSCTIFYPENYIEAHDPKALSLLISMLAYTEGQMIKIVDDDGSEIWYELRLSHQ